MYQPTLCIDVSKSKSFASAFLSPTKQFSKPFAFTHTEDGMKQVKSVLNQIQLDTNTKPTIVLEATGNYSKSLVGYFQAIGYDVVILNPLTTSTQKRKSMRKVKTDPIDTYRIAQVYYLNNCSPNISIDEKYEDLRNLCRQWDGINTLYTETQLRFQSILDLVMPDLNKVFNDLCSPTCIELVCNYPTFSTILDAGKDNIMDVLKISKQSKEWRSKKAELLLSIARESLPYDKAQQSNLQVLKSYITILKTIKKELTDMRALIVSRADSLSEFRLLTSIPGVGEITAATILGEIGDISRFDSPKKLIAYAGLDPSVFQSGKFNAKNNKISKRGSHYLRKALYQATFAGVSKQKWGIRNTTLYQYYTKKREEGKAMKSALTATSGKLLRIIYGILKNGEAFKTT